MKSNVVFIEISNIAVKILIQDGPLCGPFSHVAVVDVEGFFITGNELYNYELPGAFVFVEVKGEEKQLSSMEIGESGRIIRIASGGNLTAELDKHWIKEGNEIRALHRKEPDAHPLMVSVDACRHHIPKGLTEKIFVEVM